MLSAYLRNPESVAQQHILGNYQANEVAQSIERLASRINSDSVNSVADAATFYAIKKLFIRISKIPPIKKALDKVLDTLEPYEQQVIEKFNKMLGEIVETNCKLRIEFRKKVDSGEIYKDTVVDRLIASARGHEDNEATWAARRCLLKRGIDI